MPTVHTLPAGRHIAPMPPLRGNPKGPGRRMPGGAAPVPYRSRNASWVFASRGAKAPQNGSHRD